MKTPCPKALKKTFNGNFLKFEQINYRTPNDLLACFLKPVVKNGLIFRLSEEQISPLEFDFT